MRDRDPDLESNLIELAKPIVLGVVTARQSGNVTDAADLLQHYREDAAKLGASNGNAWSMLFSASTLWVVGLIELHAAEHNQSVSESIRQFAITYADHVANHG